MQSKQFFQPKFWHRRHLYALLLLLAAGFLGNYFRWTLFFDIDFLFGSIAVWLVICLYGLRWGTLAGLIAGFCTYIIWHHPYTMLTFTLEALFGGWLFHQRRQRNIVLADAAFWFTIGMPLVWVIYAIILQVDPTQAFIILLKQPVNGIFNALIASLLLNQLPIHRWVNRPPAIATLSLQQTFFNWLMMFVLVPMLLLIVVASQQVVDDIKTTTRSDLEDASRYLTVEVSSWYERRLSAVQELANLAALSPQPIDVLQQGAEFAGNTFTDIQHIHVLDAVGKRILDIETHEADHPQDLDDYLYFEKLQRSPQPYLSQVLLTPTDKASPIIVLGLPVMRQGKFVGAILTEFNLKGLSQLLTANLGQPGLSITLVDSQQTVVASTQPKWIGLQNFDWQQNGKIEPLGRGAYHWLPTTSSRLVMVQWNRSLFVKESTLSRALPWQLVVQLSATPHVQHIEQVHTRNLAILLAVSGVALITAAWVSRRFIKPLAKLTEVTTNLPDKLLEQSPIPWTRSEITEFALLVQNFQLMAASLQQKFREIQHAKTTLEDRVQERTRALEVSNLALSESEAKYRQLIDNLPTGVVVHAPNTNILLSNATASKLLGVGIDEMTGKLATDPAWCFYREDGTLMPLIDFPVNQVIATQSPLRNFVVGIAHGSTAANAMIWVLVNAFPEFDAQQQLQQVVVTFIDITDAKQAEIERQRAAGIVRQQTERERLLSEIALQMRQSLELEEILNTTVAEVRQFLQTDRVIVYQFQSDWSGVVLVESVATGWESIVGRRITDQYFATTGQDLYKRGHIQATEDVYKAGFAACHLEILTQIQVRANLVVPIVQGDNLWGLLIAQHCRSPRSWQLSEIDFLQQLATQAAIAIHQSELYRHEQRLNFLLEQQVGERTAQLQQALRYEALIKRMTDKVRDSLDENQILQTAVEELVHGLEITGCETTLFDLEQGTITISHAYTAGKFIAHPEVMPDTNFWDVYAPALQGQSLQFCEWSFDVPEVVEEPRTVFACPIIDDQGVLGQLRLFRASTHVFQEPEVRVVSQVASQCAIAIRQARLYQAAQVQVKALAELNQLKDDFLSTVSHELRTPISNMKMAIYMLKSVDSAERRDRYLEILQNECAREADLINDLLDLQRLASGTRVLDLEAINLQTWLEEMIPPFCDRCQNRQLKFQFNIASDLPELISDRASLNRIVAELLNNACKYTPPGENITLSVQPVATSPFESQSEGCRIQIQVCNSGVEIPAAELPRIFERFYRIRGSDRWKQGGTGLGLALVQKITEQLGGKMRVESADNLTCFTVEL